MLNGKFSALAYTNAVHVITTILYPQWCSVVAIITFHRYESLVTRPSLHFLRWTGYAILEAVEGVLRKKNRLQLVNAYLSKMEIDCTPVWISHHPHSIAG